MSDDLLDRAKEAMEGVTDGPWRREAMGGMSSVLALHHPPRSDRRCDQSYAFRGDEFCIAYPFLQDTQDGRIDTRLDFVCFGHEDARFIAASRSLVPEMADRIEALTARAEAAEAKLAQGVRVKPLVWQHFDTWTWWAESLAGTYCVTERNGFWKTELRTVNASHIIYEIDDFETAIVAAQDDHEARILSAIDAVPASQIADEALERAAQVADVWFRNLGKGNPGDEIRALKGTMK